MSDYSELKRLAEAAINDCGDYVALNDYGMAVPPAVVLELIAENDRIAHFEAAYSEFVDKSTWVAERLEPKELGQHLADVIRMRFEAMNRLEAGLREMLHRQNKEINRLKKEARND